MRRALVALLLLAAATLPGCAEPYKVRVEGRIWRDAGWAEDPNPVTGNVFGKQREVLYWFNHSSASPPFPGSLQVFSFRGLTRLDDAELRAKVERQITEGAEREHIELTGETVSGQRTIRSGAPTQWSLRTGVTTQAGTLFNDEVGVRILAEVGHDGRSDTTFVAIAYVQVERAQQCPLLVPCQPTRSEVTWIQVVGDPDGSVQGWTSSTGFIDHLVTH